MSLYRHLHIEALKANIRTSIITFFRFARQSTLNELPPYSQAAAATRILGCGARQLTWRSLFLSVWQAGSTKGLSRMAVHVPMAAPEEATEYSGRHMLCDSDWPLGGDSVRMSAGRQMSTVYQMARPGLVKTKKAGSKSWGRHQACEDLGSALTSYRLGSAGGGNKPWPSSSRMGALRSAGRPSISHWRMSPHTRDPHAGTSSRPVTQMPPGAKQSLQPREACARCPSPGPLELPRVLPKRIHRPE